MNCLAVSRDRCRRELASSSVRRGETVRLFKESFPLALTAAITLLYLRADLLILAVLRDANETGLFTWVLDLLGLAPLPRHVSREQAS